MNLTRNNLPGEIRKIRKRHYLSQMEFASKLETTQKTVSEWELGKRLIDTHFLFKIINKFNIRLTYEYRRK